MLNAAARPVRYARVAVLCIASVSLVVAAGVLGAWGAR